MRTSLPRRAVRARGGSVSIMAALSLIVVVGMAALAVDLGTLYVAKRRLQSATDLAAIAAASDLARARDAAAATLVRNGVPADSLRTIETGLYVADAALAPSSRFTPQPAGVTGVNAVRIVTQKTAPIYFGRIFAAQAADDGGIAMTGRAVATRTSLAAFAIGSRLASLDGGLLNAVLGSLLGTNLSLSLMDYQALAGAKVDALAFLGALAPRVGLSAVTYDALLDARLRVGDVLAALSDASRADPQYGPAAGILARLALAKAGSADVAVLRGVLDLGAQGTRTIGSATLGASVAALDLLTATAQVANGAHQVQAALSGSLPAGIASATVSLVVGQRPVGTSLVALGSRGATVSTAQTRLLLKVQLLGNGTVAGVSLPILIDLARSTATLAAVTCEAGDDTRGGATLAVQPGAADAWIGSPTGSDLTDLATPLSPAPATLVQVAGLVTVTGRAHATLAALTPSAVPFTAAEVASGVSKRVSNTDYVAALLAGLNRDLGLQVGVLGLGVPINLAAQTTGIVAAAAPALDQLVTTVLASLGLSVGQAEVRVTGVRCLNGVLVN